MKAYVVYFETGEWEEYSRSMVGIFMSKDKANKFVNQKRKQLDKAGLHKDGNNSRCKPAMFDADWDYRCSEAVQKQFGHVSWNGAWYSVKGPHTLDEEILDREVV